MLSLEGHPAQKGLSGGQVEALDGAELVLDAPVLFEESDGIEKGGMDAEVVLLTGDVDEKVGLVENGIVPELVVDGDVVVEMFGLGVGEPEIYEDGEVGRADDKKPVDPGKVLLLIGVASTVTVVVEYPVTVVYVSEG